MFKLAPKPKDPGELDLTALADTITALFNAFSPVAGTTRVVALWKTQ